MIVAERGRVARHLTILDLGGRAYYRRRAGIDFRDAQVDDRGAAIGLTVLCRAVLDRSGQGL
ncbi:hypothetical protein [Sandarakinorhabdus sp. DWP1-3-1]|uniref:hypothetical protein n=1 Tax=Sandarakinorhabdus sp. DWP1-3-1 TaxID=2804627 RepID=UPI003CF8106D